eukprot:109567-Chlamydomonas_euryale.AAC.1
MAAWAAKLVGLHRVGGRCSEAERRCVVEKEAAHWSVPPVGVCARGHMHRRRARQQAAPACCTMCGGVGRAHTQSSRARRWAKHADRVRCGCV